MLRYGAPDPWYLKIKTISYKSEIDQLYDIITVLLLLYWMSKYFNLCS